MSFWDHVFEDRRQASAQRSMRRGVRRGGVAIRGHNAAKVDRLTADWPSSPVPVDSMIQADLRKLRARSRWEAENDDYASRFLALLETNIIGESGIRPSPNVVGPDGEPDVAMNEAISRAWEDWGGPKKLCDVSGRLCWHDAERLFIRTCAEDGEVVVQEMRGREVGPYGYALNFVDAELLDTDRQEDLNNGLYTRLGVALNEYHRPVGYWIKEDVPLPSAAAFYLGSYFGGDSKLWSAEEIIHAFVMRRVGQKRGLPWMSTSLFRMRQLAGLEDAASVASRAGASQMGAIEREAGGDDDSAYDDEESEGGPRIVETEPGIWMELRPGEKLSGYTPHYPNEMFAPFVQSILRGISSGVNVSYASLANDSERTSYSARRADRSDEADAWRLIQRWTWMSFHQRVYRSFLVMAALSNMIKPVDGRTVGAAQAEAMAEMVDWDGRGWEAIDHDKESRSNERDIRNGVRSREEIIRARGGNPERVWRQLAAEQRMLEEMGLPTPQAGKVDEEVVRDYLLDMLGRDDDDDGGEKHET